MKEVDLKQKFWNVKTFISFLIAFTILYLLFSRLDFSSTIKVIASINPLLYLLAFLIYYLSFPLRGLRWRSFLSNAGFKVNWRDTTEILFLSWFANCLAPAKLGDIYRSYLLKKNYSFPVSKALGTVYAERMFDVIFLISTLAISGFIAFDSAIPRDVILALEIASLLAFLLLAIWFLMKRKRSEIARALPWRVKELFFKFEEGSSQALIPPAIPTALGYTLLIWLFESARLLFVILALGLKSSIAMVIFTALSASLLTSLPITPAGLGAVELAMVAMLGFAGLDSNSALSIAMLDRFISYWSILIFGAVLYIKSNKTRFET
ncbi:MAG: lysylphosphatidylglycerol synthase transmembrane domain-containing protein [Methanocellales archaeon]